MTSTSGIAPYRTLLQNKIIYGPTSLVLFMLLNVFAGCGAHPATNATAANGVGVPLAVTGNNGESQATAAGAPLLEFRGAQVTVHTSGKAAAVAPADGSPTAEGQSPENSTSGPKATFKGCWHKQSGHRYQAVDVTVGNPGKYAFNALLYNGTTCNPNNYADQFGYGQLINFGGFGYTFWFTAFPDKSDMSALWYVGGQKSQCVSYLSAPNC